MLPVVCHTQESNPNFHKSKAEPLDQVIELLFGIETGPPSPCLLVNCSAADSAPIRAVSSVHKAQPGSATFAPTNKVSLHANTVENRHAKTLASGCTMCIHSTVQAQVPILVRVQGV